MTDDRRLASRRILPRVVAVTHLFTLAWITTSIMGALYQFLPVALGVHYLLGALLIGAPWLSSPESGVPPTVAKA